MATILPLVGRRILVSVAILLMSRHLLFCFCASSRRSRRDVAAANATLSEIETKRPRDGPGSAAVAAIFDLAWAGGAGRFRQLDFIFAWRCRVDRFNAPATIELALLAMLNRRDAGIAAAVLFYVRGTRKEPIADAASIVLLSLPSSSGGCSSFCCSAWALELLLSPVACPPASSARWSPVPAGRHAAGRAVGHVLGRDQAHDPALAASASVSPTIMRVLRSSLIDALSGGLHPSGTAARLSERRILIRHALKNAILPTLS